MFGVLGFGVLLPGFLVFPFFVLDVFVLFLFVGGFFVFTMRFGVFGALLSDVRGKFRAVGGASGFDFIGFFLVELRDRFRMNFLVFDRFFFRFVLFENSATNESIGFRFFGGLFVFGFGEIGGKRGDLVFTEIGIATDRGGFLLGWSLRRYRFFTGGCGRRLGFSAAIRQEPAGKPSRESAWDAAAAGSGSRRIAGYARRHFFNGGLLFVRFMLNAGNRRGREGRLAAIFCQRFTGKNNLVLGSNGRGRRRGARSIRAPVIVSAGLAAAIVISAGFAALRRSVL